MNFRNFNVGVYFAVYFFLVILYYTTPNHRDAITQYCFAMWALIIFGLPQVWPKKFNTEDYCPTDLNDLQNVGNVEYLVYASKDRKLRDVSRLFQEPPQKVWSPKSFIASPAKDKDGIITHNLFTMESFSPGDIIFLDTGEEVVEFMAVAGGVNEETKVSATAAVFMVKL